MTNYTDKTDFEINAEIAMTLHKRLRYADSEHITETVKGGANFRLHNAIGDDFDAGTYNYCNSWADAGELINKYRIALRPAGRYKGKSRPEDTWTANHYGKDVYARNDNPLRAVCEVFLMMGDL